MVARLEEVLKIMSQRESRRTVEEIVDLLAPVVIEVPKISLSSWLRADDATSADVTTVAKTVGEAGPFRSHSTVPRPNQKPKGRVVKPGLLGPEQMTQPAPALPQ